MQVCTSLQPHNHTSTPPLSFLQAGCPSCHPTNSVKALKASTQSLNTHIYQLQIMHYTNAYLHHQLWFNCHSHGESVVSWLSSSTCSGWEPLEVTGKDFYELDAFPNAKPTVSKRWKYWRKHGPQRTIITTTVAPYLHNICVRHECPSLLWHCRLSVTKSIRPVKIEWWGYLSVTRGRLFAYEPHHLLLF